MFHAKKKYFVQNLTVPAAAVLEPLNSGSVVDRYTYALPMLGFRLKTYNYVH